MSTNQPFVMTPTAVIFDTRLPALVRLTFAALEDFSGEHRTCWPGYAAIAKKVGCSARWVPELLKKLVEAGLLVIQTRQGRTNIYTLVGRVTRRKATQEYPSGAPMKAASDNQKQTKITNNNRANRRFNQNQEQKPPVKKPINFDNFRPGGRYGFLDAVGSR